MTSISRSEPNFSFAEPDAVTQISADRTDEARMRELALRIELGLVIDCTAFYPRDVEVAVEAFADADAYVYVSSGGAYSRQEIPKREDETPLHDCSAEQATDDTMASYGPRKAEGDRITRMTDALEYDRNGRRSVGYLFEFVGTHRLLPFLMSCHPSNRVMYRSLFSRKTEHSQIWERTLANINTAPRMMRSWTPESGLIVAT